MKKVTLFASILALALTMTMTASAQQVIDFDSLPDATGTPAASPDRIQRYVVDGMDYVSAAQYAYAGAGFFTGNHAQLAFGGGPLCFPDTWWKDDREHL